MTAVEPGVADNHDAGLAKQFATLRPTIERLLSSFAQLAQVPVAAFLEGKELYRYWPDPAPVVCDALRRSETHKTLCANDWSRRSLDADDSATEAMCHAGLLTRRVSVDLGAFGRLVVFYDAVRGNDTAARARHRAVLEEVGNTTVALRAELEPDTPAQARETIFDDQAVELLKSITDAIGTLVRSASEFRAMSISMAHEVAVMMVGVGLLSDEARTIVEDDTPSAAGADVAELKETHRHIVAECRLGLYIVRNYLSHTSELRYRQVVRPQFQSVNVSDLVLDMTELYERFAAEKQLVFDVAGVDETPTISGSEMELRRLIHNVLNNAVKYSYRTVPGTSRSIRLWTKNPYDPGFRQRRFSMSIANYGIGLEKEELTEVMKPGFRGRHAIAEVPIGAGIGLSEAAKIMKVHGGEIKLKSEQLHSDPQKGSTFLTTVELIFPAAEKGRSSSR